MKGREINKGDGRSLAISKMILARGTGPSKDSTIRIILEHISYGKE